MIDIVPTTYTRDMRQAKFSIVITCHNQCAFIGAAVDSALLQSGASKEVIVVDDGSSDGSLEILRSYGESLRLSEFPVNRGAIEARNYGARLARGAYLVFLDGDDVLTPWALDVYENIVVEHHPAVILGCSSWFEGSVPQLNREDLPRQIEFARYETFLRKDRPAGLSASTYVVDRHSFWAAGGWSPGIFHLDLQDLSTKLGYSGCMILICSPATAYYRIHSGNSILSVAPFVQMAHRLLEKERAGMYPGGREHRFERYAWLGGLMVFWTKRALRARLYRDAFRLLTAGLPMVLAAIYRRLISRMGNRRPLERSQLHPSVWSSLSRYEKWPFRTGENLMPQQLGEAEA